MTTAAKTGRWALIKRSFEAAAAPACLVLALLILAFFMLVLPGAVVYTVVWGERAVATIETCEQRQVRSDTTYLDCRGGWRFPDGTRGFGHVSGVDRSDIGQEVPVRVGPLGPYAGGLGRSRHALLPGALLWTVALPVAGIYLRFLLRARAQARRVLVRAGGGDAFTVGRRRLRDGRGRTLLKFRTSSRPPTVLARAEAARHGEGRLATRRPFVAARPPTGGDALFIVRLAGGSAVFDANGRPVLVVKRAARSPLLLEVLAPDRTPLGRIVPYPGDENRSGIAFALTMEARETVAIIVAGLLRWTVVFRGDPSAPLRHAATAFAFDALRLTR